MAITLANLRSRARQRADMENSTFVADSEANIYINDGYKELYQMVADKLPERLVGATPTEFTISSGNTQSLASDFAKLWGLDYQVSTNRWIPIGNAMPLERNQGRYRYITNFYDRVKFRLLGNVIRIEPEDNANGTYRYWYVPTVTELSGDSDEINSEFERTGWYDYIVAHAAAKMLAKEESSTVNEEKIMAKIADRIQTEATNRDLSMPMRIQDVQYLDSDDPYNPIF